MTLSPAWAAALFMPATVGLLYQAVQPHPWPNRLLALALMLMSLEQAHMARVDLRHRDLVGQRTRDPRLGHFGRVVVLAIAGQVAGFSIAALGHLGWGMGLILVSLLGFNLAATIRLEPASPKPIQSAGWRSRLDVLGLDAIALVLAILWIAQRAQGWVAGGLFAITVLYGSSKLVAYVTALRSDSTIHVAHATQEHPQTSQQN
ncbi:hypothetical protein [Phormidium tenue]|uniref:Uncharacterized protein n=1 Tax=Phormidium tenue NIES-30 TaxID=549789 RepID=A0A1U7J0C0_9CYAN|nr:hypothetical protein [Phormidium tenue]MBD2234356.1 hypothetical protein [Phormidium tenue FACHB-1052]OKH44997.1 hypothetical protein NIES30_21155 [Phormidium tenue NIES-30]